MFFKVFTLSVVKWAIQANWRKGRFGGIIQR